MIGFGLKRYGAAGWMRKAAALLFSALLPAGPALAAPVTIVALGDSLTHGYGLPAEDGLVPQLEAWLRANGAPEARVINAGVSGDTTAGGLARFDWSVPQEADGLIVELGGNDLLRGVDPAASRANIEAILGKARARGLPVLLTGMRAPLNYGPEYKAAFDAIFPELAAKYGAIYDPFFLDGMVGEPGLFQPDGIHPNAAGVKRLVERFGPVALRLVRRIEAAQ